MKYLIQKCYIDTNKARISHEFRRPKAAIQVKGDYTIMQNNRMINQLVIEMIRLTDTKKAKIDYIVLQYKDKWKYIDSKVRNYFNAGLSIG